MTALQANDIVIYTNLVNVGFYRYPRAYETDIDYENKQIILDGKNLINITITGIPETVSPFANEAMIRENTPYRMYIYSEVPINEVQLQQLDMIYGKRPFPVYNSDIVVGNLRTFPKNNFYLTNELPNSTTQFTEYRYLKNRNIISRIAYNLQTNDVYTLVLSHRPQLVIIMPDNFVRTTLKSGYFQFDNGLIVRVFSKFILSSSKYTDSDDGSITEFNISNRRLVSKLRSFFTRMGIHKIASTSNNHIFGYDKFIVMIVGSLSNVILN